MLNRGGRYFNQIGRPAPVGVHIVANPRYIVEQASTYAKQIGNRGVPNKPKVA